MLRKCVKSTFVFLVCVSFIIVNPHFGSFSVINTYAMPSSVTVKGTSVNVRSGPGTNYRLIGTVQLGYRIMPMEVLNDSQTNGKTWYKFNYNGQNGYIRSDFCKEATPYVYDANFENDLTVKRFPESYKAGLRELHAMYPNWIFTLHNNGYGTANMLERCEMIFFGIMQKNGGY